MNDLLARIDDLRRAGPEVMGDKENVKPIALRPEPKERPMPELVRFDADDLVVRKNASTRWGAAGLMLLFGVWTAVGGAAIILARAWGGNEGAAFFLFMGLLGLLLSTLAFLPEHLHISFRERSYQLITDWDRLMLRREGRKGSFEEFDRVRFTQQVGEGGFMYEIQLLWKHAPRRPYALLGTSFSEVDASGLAERRELAKQLAEKLGVELEDQTK
jgi:hypothetical protein